MEKNQPIMSIDERLETLTQSVDLLAEMQRDMDARYDQRCNQIMDAITRLTNIIEAHERRLDELENSER
jgi:prefoldin subunit 5